MEQYINKAALVAEIKRRISVLKANESVISMLAGGMFVNEFKDLLSFLDTLEVKEIGVDLGDPKGDKSAKHIIDTKTLEVKEVEEPSKDLEEAADNYVGHAPEIDEDLSCFIRRNAFIAGAQWQKEQMEKNRIAHCDNITEEQYNLETGFLDDFLDKNKRMPTFLDAIEYGMKKAQKG